MSISDFLGLKRIPKGEDENLPVSGDYLKFIGIIFLGIFSCLLLDNCNQYRGFDAGVWFRNSVYQICRETPLAPQPSNLGLSLSRRVLPPIEGTGPFLIHRHCVYKLHPEQLLEIGANGAERGVNGTSVETGLRKSQG